LNQLRGRVVLQVDGQIKTGRDVVIGALLGADEFGFATAPLVVEGCIMMRKCHLNTCPVGVATQDPELRKRFTGQPEHVVNYFFFVAEEVREYMASMGIAKFADLIGRADLLDTQAGIDHWKISGLDFSKVFHQPDMPASVSRKNNDVQDHGLVNALDNKLVALAQPALEKGEKVVMDIAITNTNRTVGTMLSNQIATRYGNAGLPDDTIHVNFTGTSGQSFSAFLAKGITFSLTGEGNDYVGKGLCGGRIVIKPPKTFRGISHQNIIVGNAVMYGATTGESYFSGVAGERFCVRNSGASAVVEGVGNHGCEYMTGGTVVVLGVTGQNFAAGMSGGVAYVYDEDGMFAKRCNMGMVSLEKVEHAATVAADAVHHLDQPDEVTLLALINKHAEYTDSGRAKAILADWENARGKFVKVMPNEYKRALVEMAEDKALIAA
jgi:glutamate synthase (NADPH/NADH) large chain